MATAEPIKNLDNLRDLANYFLELKQYRNHAMIVLGASTALRIGDLLNLKWSNFYDEVNDRFHTHIYLTEKKTNKKKIIALSDKCIEALKLLYPHKRSIYVFDNNHKNSKPITRHQAWIIITRAAKKLGLEGAISCHSLRKTFGYAAWSSGKASPVLIMEIYKHSSYFITKRYLGITQDDMDELYTGLELF